MPSHPDRVRRNYHDISIVEIEDPKTGDIIYSTRISRIEIASIMSAKEVQREVARKVIKHLGPSR